MSSSKPFQLVIGVAMAALILLALVVVPPSGDFETMFGDGNLARIMFFHVPCALVSFLSFVVAAVHAGRYLKRRDPQSDLKSAVAIELGLFFCVIAAVTGAVFAKTTWGAYWHWDPRQTSLAILLLMYAAYLALRGAVVDPETRASVSAVYALLSIVAGTFLFFVVPRIPAMHSIHPDVIAKRGGMDPVFRTVFFFAMAVFTGLYAWIYGLSVQVRRMAAER
jgi:heme exporter protein C